jgi:hypothetical protein
MESPYILWSQASFHPNAYCGVLATPPRGKPASTAPSALRRLTVSKNAARQCLAWISRSWCILLASSLNLLVSSSQDTRASVALRILPVYTQPMLCKVRLADGRRSGPNKRGRLPRTTPQDERNGGS